MYKMKKILVLIKNKHITILVNIILLIIFFILSSIPILNLFKYFILLINIILNILYFLLKKHHKILKIALYISNLILIILILLLILYFGIYIINTNKIEVNFNKIPNEEYSFFGYKLYDKKDDNLNNKNLILYNDLKDYIVLEYKNEIVENDSLKLIYYKKGINTYLINLEYKYITEKYDEYKNIEELVFGNISEKIKNNLNTYSIRNEIHYTFDFNDTFFKIETPKIINDNYNNKYFLNIEYYDLIIMDKY